MDPPRHPTTTAAVSSSAASAAGGGEADAPTRVLDRPGRDCPACGAVSAASRELCGRCGADLDTGMVPPRPRAATPEPAPGRWVARPGRRRHRWPRVAAAVGAVVLLLAVALGVAGVAPWGRGSLPEAAFAADEHPEEPRPLLLRDIATRTRGPAPDGRPSDPRWLVDGDLETAWRSDGQRLPGGEGETVDLHFEHPVWVDRLVLRNGDQRDGDAYAHHGRLRRAEVRLDGGERARVRFEDLGRRAQVVELPEPRLTTALRIEVREVFAGDERDDVAVADLQVLGWRARGEDAEAAAERARRAPADGRRPVPRGAQSRSR